MILMLSKLSPILALLLAIGACASNPPASRAEPQISASRVSALGPQTLAANECGLFIWSKTDRSRFIFFSRAESGRAIMQIAGRTASLEQTANRGDIFGQFMTQQAFRADTGEVIDLVITPGEVLDGGQRIGSGGITITDQEGWQTFLPILGVRACQSK